MVGVGGIVQVSLVVEFGQTARVVVVAMTGGQRGGFAFALFVIVIIIVVPRIEIDVVRVEVVFEVAVVYRAFFRCHTVLLTSGGAPVVVYCQAKPHVGLGGLTGISVSSAAFSATSTYQRHCRP
jgi:hypothetical protein